MVSLPAMHTPKWISVVAVSAVLALTGCTAAATTDADAKTGGTGTQSTSKGGTSWLPADAVVHQNLAYGSDPLQKLDVYQPAGAEGAPIILMVHGGSWKRGDKAASGVVHSKVEHYLPKGYLVVSINYRLSPAVNPLTQAKDVASALVFTQENAAKWGGSARSVILMGHSAGAHLVALVSADPMYAQDAGALPWLGTIALDSAAYNVVTVMSAPHLPLYDPIFNHDEQLWRDASPTLRLSGNPSPLLLVCGSRRADSCPQANGFATAADTLGTRTQVYPIDLSHGEINSELGAPGPLTDTVDTFLDSLNLT